MTTHELPADADIALLLTKSEANYLSELLMQSSRRKMNYAKRMGSNPLYTQNVSNAQASAQRDYDLHCRILNAKIAAREAVS